METTITIDRERIYEALTRTTAYLGTKQADSTAASTERIALNEGDKRLLERFWHESREPLLHTLRRMVTAEGLEGTHYRMDLTLSEAFDPAMETSLQEAISNYFIQALAARWLAITDRATSADFGAAAAATLETIGRQACCKRAPRRPRYGF